VQPSKAGQRLPVVKPTEVQASCRTCLKSSVCAILRNQIALSKQFPQLDSAKPDAEGDPRPMFDPFATALTCVEYFPPDVRLFADVDPEEQEALR
jgi:hypothetical protein